MLLFRIRYLLLTVLIIILGLTSRKVHWIPTYVGDLLWASMIFMMIRIGFVKKPTKTIVIVSLSFCYLIEVSQLYQANWINELRNTQLGSLILGHGFLWSDLIAYSIGVLLAIFLDLLIKRQYDVAQF